MAGIPFTMSSEQYAKQIREAEKRGAVKALRAWADFATSELEHCPTRERRDEAVLLVEGVRSEADRIESGGAILVTAAENPPDVKAPVGIQHSLAVQALREAAAAWRANGLAWGDPDEETNTDLLVARKLDERADRIERGEQP
jgi:hypothetical protein